MEGVPINTEHKSHTPIPIRDLWQTPRYIFDSLNAEFNFTTDVAAASYNHLCSHYITEEEDGLKADWGLINWCNPPYSSIGPWISKAITEFDKGNSTVMLVPSDTSVRWFREAFITCSEIRFIAGRISFINSETQRAVAGNNKGSVLLIWDSEVQGGVNLIDRETLKEVTV